MTEDKSIEEITGLRSVGIRLGLELSVEALVIKFISDDNRPLNETTLYLSCLSARTLAKVLSQGADDLERRLRDAS